MRKKVVVAMLTAMTLTLGSVSVLAANGNQSTEERPGYVWVIDREEEGHYETIHHEAVTETIHHEAVTETVHHEAEYETIHHEEEGHYEDVQVGSEPIYETHGCAVCNLCDAVIWDNTRGEDFSANLRAHMKYHGTSISYRGEDVQVQVGEKPIYEQQWVVDKAAWDEQVIISEAWDEIVLVQEAWDETVIIKEAYDEQIWVVDVPEQGHWEPVDPEQPVDPEEPVDPEAPVDPEEPTEPTTPVEPIEPEEPTEPEEPITPVEPEIPDSENDDSQQEATPTPEAPATDDNSTSGDNTSTDNKIPDTTKSDGTGKVTAPQTGDPGSLGYVVSLAGSALASGSALVYKFKKKK